MGASLLGINHFGEVMYMELFISIEAQNCTENGLADILQDINFKLSFITNKSLELQQQNNYGTEFCIISIIPTCVDDSFWEALGWKERIRIMLKKKEAEVRLRMNYTEFEQATMEKRRLMFINIIIKSIQVVQDRSKGDFNGLKLIDDILTALNN